MLNQTYLVILLVFVVLILYTRITSTYTTSTPSSSILPVPLFDANSAYQDISPTDTTTWTATTYVKDPSTTISLEQLNINCWNKPNCWGIRHSFDADKGSWYLMTNPTGKTKLPTVLATVSLNGVSYSLPNAVVIAKSVANPLPCTTTVPSGSYVSAACTDTTNTQFAPATSCSTNQYLANFSPGSSTTAGSPGSCSPCATTVPSGSYVSAACTPATNTQFAPATSCSTNQYLANFSAGSSTTAGSPGSCLPCPYGQTSTGTSACRTEVCTVYANDYPDPYYEKDATGTTALWLGSVRDAIAQTKSMGDSVFWINAPDLDMDNSSRYIYGIISKSSISGTNVNNIIPTNPPGPAYGTLWYISETPLPTTANAVFVGSVSGSGTPNSAMFLGLACPSGRTGGFIYTPTLNWNGNGSVGSYSIRIRGTTQSVAVSSSTKTRGDVYAEFKSNFTGTVFLEKTDGTLISSQVLNNKSNVFFSGVLT